MKPRPQHLLRTLRPLPLVAAAMLAWVSTTAIVAAAPIAGPHTKTELQSKSPVDLAYRKGLQALSRGDAKAAEQAFQETLRLDGEHVDAHLGLAEVAFGQRRLDAAATHLDRALKIAPDNARALASQGRMLVLNGKPKEAETALRNAIAADAKLVRPKLDLADMLATRRSFEEATALYRQVIELDRRHGGAHYALGQTLQAQNQLDAAAAAYRSAGELAPNSVLAPLALARLELGRQRAPAAMAAVEQLLKRQPTLMEALVVKGDIQEQQGNPDAALKSYAEAAKHAPKAPLPLLRAAMVEHRRGKLDAAEAGYLKLLQLDASQPMALNNLAALAVDRKKDLAQAETWARSATRLAPNVPAFLDTLATVQRAQGRPADAIASWRQAQKMSPKDAELMFQLGRALAEGGDKTEARKWLQQALDMPSGLSAATEARRLLASLP